MIPIYKPYLPEYITKYAKDAIDSTWISSIGKYKDMAIEQLQNYFKIKYVILTNNGTSALHLVSKATQFSFPERRSIFAPDNVYISCWNCFLYDRYYGIKVIPTNINTWNFDYNHIEDGNIILCVHNLGNIINIDTLKKMYPNSVFVEDNCEGLFGKYNGKFSGTDSFCSACSFFGNKNITSGEGGAFFTNNLDVYNEMHKIHGQGQTNRKFIHDVLGYNYRMTNVQAAFIYGSMLHIDEILERKKFIFEYYREKFADIDGVLIQTQDEGTEHSNWMMGVRIKNRKIDYNNFFLQKGIETRPMFYPISYHLHLSSSDNSQTDQVSELLSEECFFIPSFPELDKKQLDYIIENVKMFSLENSKCES